MRAALRGNARCRTALAKPHRCKMGQGPVQPRLLCLLNSGTEYGPIVLVSRDTQTGIISGTEHACVPSDKPKALSIDG
ncbi:MAG: hypothetical protein CMJ62_16270 [Planctomycetaceae bacterium]|nr:hypothetical protein [Planctomycetaceae bacterium]